MSHRFCRAPRPFHKLAYTCCRYQVQRMVRAITGVYHYIHFGSHVSVSSRLGTLFLRRRTKDLTRALLTPLTKLLTTTRNNELQRCRITRRRQRLLPKCRTTMSRMSGAYARLLISLGVQCEWKARKGLANNGQGQAYIQYGMRRYANLP